MRYRLLLHSLRALIYLKRATWWGGRRLGAGLGWLLGAGWRLGAPLIYRLSLVLKRQGLFSPTDPDWWLTRRALQAVGAVLLGVLSLSETVVVTGEELLPRSQTTIAFRLVGNADAYSSEEALVGSDAFDSPPLERPALVGGELAGRRDTIQGREFSPTLALSGTALVQPMFVNTVLGPRGSRLSISEYIITPGDSLSSIAADFGVNVSTIMWENNLSLTSILRPGDRLRILPVNGVTHIVKKGETLVQLARRYEVKTEEILKLNRLSADGSSLIVGERIIIPGGVRPEARGLAQAPRTTPAFRRVVTPQASRQAPTVSGFVWPAGARHISQYFNWRHNGLDIAGPWQTAIYAARSGVVEIARCGWNGGYGCYLIINHGGGLKSLYGHNAQLLVAVGEEVETGQTVALMGNTGKVRGRTGIHVHFEVIVNGRRVNPLRYVR